MICYKCSHSIIRVLWDGVSENEVIHCELDNVQVSRQMRKCSREKVPVVEYVPPPEIVEPEPILKAGSVIEVDLETLKRITPKNLPDIIKEMDAKPKYKGWPKGKPRGKRGT